MGQAVLKETIKDVIEATSLDEQGVNHLDWKQFYSRLPNNSIDLVLTDPPYAISRETGFSKLGKNSVDRFAVSMDFGKWDHQPIDIVGFCKESYRTLKPSGTAIIWYDLWKITDLEQAMKEAGFKMIRLIIWQKTNPVPLNQSSTYLSNSREIAVVGVKGGKPVFNGKYDNGIYELPIPRHKGGRKHPTQKPLALFEELIVKHSNQNALVVDPFLGSGTTGVAAIRKERKFQGSEIDSKYVKIAKQRILDRE